MDNETLQSQLFFSKEAAKYLGITVQRLNKLVLEGKIRPLKKNASGTLFYIDELNRRKEELDIFLKVSTGGGTSMFAFDTKPKLEALNYATLMNILGYTENRLEPLFDKLGEKVKLDIPLVDNAFIS